MLNTHGYGWQRLCSAGLQPGILAARWKKEYAPRFAL
jgi:hypothetical protein